MLLTISPMLLLRLLAWLLSPSLALPVTPAPLVCLHKYYGVAIVPDAIELPDGTRIPYDDGRVKSPEERLEHPDVEDTFTPRYRKGAIEPVTTPDHDPGRARLDALFAAIYPAKSVVRARFLGRAVEIHARVAPALSRVAARLETLIAADPTLRKFVSPIGGTLNVRKIAGTDRLSAHAYGIAIDLNPDLSNYWRWEKSGWKNRIPQSIVDAFEAEGFIWGGRWAHFDTMHFEYRPELLDDACRP